MRLSGFFAMLFAVMSIAIVPAQAKPRDPVKVTSASALKGTQRVVIGQFTLGFLVERKDSTKAGGGFGGRSTTRSSLQGYTAADLQSVADAAYVDFEQRLKTAGLEVVDRAALVQHAAFAKTKPLAAPYEISVVTGRDDKAKVLFVSASHTAPLRIYAGDAMVGGLGGMGLMMSGNQVSMGASDFAKTAAVHVINAIYYVDFADSEEYGGWFRSSSAVGVKGSLALLPDQSKITVISPNYKTASLALANPVAVGGDFFETADAMSSGEKASQTLGNVVGFLGGVGTNSSKKLSFTARPGAYVPAATEAAIDANALLIDRLVALR